MYHRFLKPVIGSHDGSSFREMLDLWGERGFCRIEPIVLVQPSDLPDDLKPEARVWYGDVGDVLLYDQTILDRVPKEWNYGLFANQIFQSNKSCSWIFWQRWPREYEQVAKERKERFFTDRENDVIFIGNLTTPKRSMFDWKECVDFFKMGSMHNNSKNNMLYSYKDYILNINNSKFGLCLPGQGPKCLRDTEVMGVGTVPIFTPGVSLDYYEKMEEGVHYFYAKNPEEVKEIVKNCSEERWEKMSKECLEWFQRNCSVEGSYKTTCRILDERGLML